MLPYLQLQSSYVIAAGVLVGGLDWLAGRCAFFAASARWRALAVLAILAVLALIWALAVRHFNHSHSSLQFISVALGFYGGSMWIPLIALVRGCRRPRDPGLLVFASLALLVGQYALWIEPNRLTTTNNTVLFEQWPSADPVRVVHISDLQTVGECSREREAAAKINALRPDLIVVTGDYVAGPFFDAAPAIAAARSFFRSLERPRWGIVCVDGHCESARVRALVFEGLDVVYLNNQTVEFEIDAGRKLRLFGAKTLHQGFDLSKFDERREDGLVTLIASHEPDVSWEIEGRGVDLHLAGHTHGGQITLPFYGPPLTLSALPRSFARGLHAFGDHWLNVNPGIGMEGNHAPRIRWWCPPQIDLLLLNGGGDRRLRADVPVKG